MKREFGVGAYFDGAIMSTPHLTGTEASFLFVSGESETTFKETPNIVNVSYILNQLGRTEYLGSDPGAAALYDLALLPAMYGMFGGTLTGIALLSKSPTPQKVSDTVSRHLVLMLQAMLPSLVNIATVVETQDYGAHGHPNTMQLHGLRYIAKACKEEGVDFGPLCRLKEVFEEVEQEGGDAGGMGVVGAKFSGV